MKKIIFTTLAVSFISVSFTAFAQQDHRSENRERSERPEKKEQQEIIIRSDADTNIVLKIEIKGDDVIINGKTLGEFKDDGITINKRKMIVRDGDDNMTINLDGNMEALADLKNLQELKFDQFNQQFNKENQAFDKAGKRFKHRSFLGVTTEKTTDGAKIVEIMKGSAAEKAGLQKEDVITKIDKQPVTDADVLAAIIATKKPADEIKIYYKRAGKKKEVKAVLGENKNNRQFNFDFQNPDAMVRGFKMNPPDVRPDLPEMNENGVMNLGPDGVIENIFPRQKRLGLKIQDTEEGGNVKIIDVEDSSTAQKAGLKKDDLITEINGQKVENTDQAREQLHEAAEKSTYTIKATRAGTEMTFEVKIPKKLKTANL